jgi:hypothetical protein
MVFAGAGAVTDALPLKKGGVARKTASSPHPSRKPLYMTKTKRLTAQKICLYVLTVIAAALAWWFGRILMETVLLGFPGVILCVFAVALPVVVLVQEVIYWTKK